MKRSTMSKAATVAAAAVLPAAGLVLATQSNADAAVTTSCGRNFSPSKATYAVTVEEQNGENFGTYRYPNLSLREGIVDGYSSVMWARQSVHISGSLDLDWYKSPNDTTHYACRYQSQGPYTRNYTQGVLVGENDPPGADALAFRPCQRSSYSNDVGLPPGPWQCAGWYYF